MSMQRYLIIGAGLAGHTAALELRQKSASASITLLGEELHLPYDRPPLTKGFLLDRVMADDVMLAKSSTYREMEIDFRPGCHVIRLDREAKTVVARNGDTFAYDKLLLTTGSRARKVEFAGDATAPFYLRTLDDCIALKTAIARSPEICVIGGGFIGLELAAAARLHGCKVTVVEAGDQVLSRGMPRKVSDFISELHKKNGVDIVLNQSPVSIKLTDDGRRAVVTKDREFAVDLIVAGVGVIPNTKLARAAGLETDDGIVIDAHCQTSDPNIFAAGEVTRHPTGAGGKMRRIESWRIAARQPVVAADCMTGGNSEYDDPPWLWSDQFDVNVQLIGDPLGGDQQVIHKSDRSNGWTVISVFQDMRPCGAVAIDNGRDISILRRVLQSNGHLPDKMLKKCEPMTLN